MMLYEPKYDSSFETYQHKERVQTYILAIMDSLAQRGLTHDQSKLESPEKEIFDEYSPKLKELQYGTTEYFDTLKKMQVALDHHYGVNNHHPEHFENGIRGMTLIDIIEMFCDWMAACERTKNGNILDSLETNQSRFNFSDDLKSIFINTVHELQQEK